MHTHKSILIHALSKPISDQHQTERINRVIIIVIIIGNNNNNNNNFAIPVNSVLLLNNVEVPDDPLEDTEKIIIIIIRFF